MRGFVDTVQGRMGAVWLLVFGATFGCKHTSGGSNVASAAGSGPLIDAMDQHSFDPASEFYVLWLPYEHSPDVDSLPHKEVAFFDRAWVSYRVESFLTYMNGLIASKHLPQDGGFADGTPMLVTKKTADHPLYLKWNAAKTRFDNSDTVHDQTLNSFLDAEGGLTAPKKTPLFVVESAPSKAADQGRTAYAGELDGDGVRQGPGILVAHDYSVMSGTFVKGRLQGAGKLIDASGVGYEGNFVDDHLTGDFKVTFPSGNIYLQHYSLDVRISSSQQRSVDQGKVQGEGGYLYGQSVLRDGSVVQADAPHYALQEAEDPSTGSSNGERTATGASRRVDSPDAQRSGASTPPPDVRPAVGADDGARGR